MIWVKPHTLYLAKAYPSVRTGMNEPTATIWLIPKNCEGCHGSGLNCCLVSNCRLGGKNEAAGAAVAAVVAFEEVWRPG